MLPQTYTELERSNHFKKASKTKCTQEHIVSVNDHVIREIFIQTVLYNGALKKTYACGNKGATVQ